MASHRFAAQRAGGVLVTISSDDPATSGTTIADDDQQVAAIALDGTAASCAPLEENRARPARFQGEVAP